MTQKKNQKILILKDYLRSGDKIAKCIQSYANEVLKSSDEIDLVYANALIEFAETISDKKFTRRVANDSDRIFNFFESQHPELLFQYSTRVKTAIEADKKINMLIFKTPEIMDEKLGDKEEVNLEFTDYLYSVSRFRDAIASRAIISGAPEEKLIDIISEYANSLIPFMIKLGYVPIPANRTIETSGNDAYKLNIKSEYLKYYKDYITFPKKNGYQSLHIVFKESRTGRFLEIQIRTLKMHLVAEHGSAHHGLYKIERYALDVQSHPEIAKALFRCEAMDYENIDFNQIKVSGFETMLVPKDSVALESLNVATEVGNHMEKNSMKIGSKNHMLSYDPEQFELKICDMSGVVIPRMLYFNSQI